ncbi:hypothetical protein OJAV_G00220240 [Oryzias javanicus]|uniref:Uncharacterized protein n=1 Tax=Oryzias javanicus TaxID=123683 RepID=A0A3S2MCE5_ORYJA|nr:hypothetical protein OJAV_G00220240 [Oryzias javanicus]
MCCPTGPLSPPPSLDFHDAHSNCVRSPYHHNVPDLPGGQRRHSPSTRSTCVYLKRNINSALLGSTHSCILMALLFS